jgi:hypothetical protein
MVHLSRGHMSFSTLLFSQPKAAGTLDVTYEPPALVNLENTDGKFMHFGHILSPEALWSRCCPMRYCRLRKDPDIRLLIAR